MQFTAAGQTKKAVIAAFRIHAYPHEFIFIMVETKRIELSTSRMRTERSPGRYSYMPRMQIVRGGKALKSSKKQEKT